MRYGRIIAAAVLGVLATLGAYLLVCSWEYRVAEIDFQSKAKSSIEVMNADLGDARTLLYTIAAFINANDRPITSAEFGEFSASLHRRVNGLRDTAWAPHVSLAERARFEAAARGAGISGYEIRQIGPRGTLARAQQRANYFALLYIEAGATKRSMLGVDLIAEKRRARAVLRALRTGRPAATPPMDVVTVKQPGGGVLGYMPVYARQAAGARRHAVRGVVLGVFDIPVMVDNILAHNSAMRGLRLYLFNPAAAPGRRVVYRTPTNGLPPSEDELLAGAHWQTSVVIIDQPLGAIVTPAQPLPRLRLSLFGTTTLLVGFAMTALIVAYLVLSLRRTLELEALTASLQATTLTLHEKAEEITRISRHDALTQLPNRLLFQERMTQAVARFGRGAPFALLFLDLDRFKAVNDTLGHGTGDRLLCAVSERISQCVREVDTAARLGGDEFAIILSDVADPATIATIANRLIASIGKEYLFDDVPVSIGVSIGAAIATPGVTAGSIIAEADLAMYEAKEAGRGLLRIFETTMRARVDEKRLLEDDLRRGLARGELEVHYQPLIDLAEGRVAGFEALVRWRHPRHGMVPPDRFIPVAEECGLIGELGAWVMRTACADAAGWPRPVNVAVNISPLQLKNPALLSEILTCLAATGLAPGRLEIELTEAAVLGHSENTLTLLRQLRTIGVAVAFDDFGTGYSSLSSLLRFPFDKIKIDRSFVAQVETSSSAAAIVRAVTSLGSSLAMKTTGEGIETFEQLDMLRLTGCTEAQGYLFSPARPNAEVAGLLLKLDLGTESQYGPVPV